MTEQPERPATGACWNFRIRGRVQGVGFRYFTRQEARRLDLRGWVCNRPDGSVESLAIGSQGQIERFEQALRQGPGGSRVRSVEKVEANDSGEEESFEIVY